MHLALTVKVTRLCNLRCTYCTDWRAGAGHTMSFEVIANLIAKALSDEDHTVVSFGWHGGDPLVLNPKFFKQILQVQARYRRPGQMVRNAVQTNGTLFDPEWLDFIRAHEIGLGISLDGPPEIHDRQRIDRFGAGTFEQVLAGIQLLQSEQIPFGTLMTVGTETVEAGAPSIYEFFRSIGISEYGFNAARPANPVPNFSGHQAVDYVDRRTMSGFLIDLYNHVQLVGDETVKIRELEMIRNRIRAEGRISCRIEGECVGRYFMIEPDGTVAHCARFQGDDAYTFGNIVNTDFARVRRSLKLIERRQDDKQRAARRAECSNFDVCAGGCPHDDYIARSFDKSHSETCCGMNALIDHIRSAEGEHAVTLHR